MRKIAHIINPVLVDESSDLFVAQPVTFESMRIARDFAVGQVEVELFSAQYPEDHPVTPADFHRTPDLERSVLDYGDFQKQRKLPLLKDILDRLYQDTDAEYLIYTNVDIGLLPHFYLTVDQFIETGHDAFVINRRTISDRHQSVEQIPLMYAEVGKPHRGWDCFIFRRDAYPQYQLGSVCIGASRVGLVLLSSMVAYASSFWEFKNEHLTFHIGDERNWLNKAYADYDKHNTRQLLEALEILENKVGAFGRDTIPGSFLLREQRFGPLYDLWARHVYLPMGLSQFVNRIVRRP
jgi:hypothetical protein